MIRRSLAATALSALMFWFGTGLTPLAWLIWLAPLPVLMLAPRVPARVAGLVGGVAWFLGALNMWSYFHGSIELPVPMLVGYLLATAMPFPLAVLLHRALLVRGHVVLAAVAVPTLWVGAEYLVSLVSPAGAFWSLAYTQADIRAVRGIAALTGLWGISFLIMAVPAVLAVLLTPDSRRRLVEPGPQALPQRIPRRPRAAMVLRRLPLAAAAVGLLGMALGYGCWPSSSAAGPTVALIALDQSVDTLPVDSAEGQLLLDRYAERIRAAGTDIVVLPEKVFLIADLAAFAARFASVAVNSGTDVVIGLVHDGYNSAMLFRADGSPPVTYHKRHLIPGLEDHLRVGDSAVLVDGVGLAVCKDLDYPALGRENARRGARLLLVPALDFDRDAWLHSRMATMRGVESGFAVARSSEHGLRTLSDARGEIVKTDRVRLPTGSTPYARFGDWFPRLCLLVVVVAAVPLTRSRRGRYGQSLTID